MGPLVLNYNYTHTQNYIMKNYIMKNYIIKNYIMIKRKLYTTVLNGFSHTQCSFVTN